MSNNNKRGQTPFERRRKIYQKYGLKPVLVHKTGALIINDKGRRN